MKKILFLSTGIVMAIVIIALQSFEWKHVATKRNFVDVSHTIEDGMITYKGIPAPVISSFLSREASASRYSNDVKFIINRINMVANTGTYLDAPFHRYEEGKDLANIDLENLAYLDAVIVSVEERVKTIDASYFKNIDVKGKAVLVHTGWDKHWRKETYCENHPYLTADAARWLSDKGVKLIGIDSYNIDDTNDKRRPVHSLLLKNGIPIIEHLCNLGGVPKDRRIEFNAVPVKVKDFSTFPVRAFITW